ncbi:unnamed protein product [Fusarium langsethiae]|nr:unnamed protein product [Fusarium langsethiae]GKU11726.1 unnamed protein product [Fusarium langsethiae]
MPQRSFSHQVQSVWDRLTRRRGARKPRRYADVAAAQRRSQALDSCSHANESLLSFGQFLGEGGRLYPPLASVTANISPNAAGPSNQNLIGRSINRSTIYDDPSEERVKIPVVLCATSKPDAPDEGEEVEDPVWFIPGDESYPLLHTQGCIINGELFQEPRKIYRVRANGQELFVPIDTFIPDIDADVLNLLLGIHLSPSGLVGHEDGINLPLMLTALSFAFDHGLDFEIDNLKNTIGRYIVSRMFHHNPHSKSFSLGKEYFAFRSEEIYRAWVAVTNDKRLQTALTPDDLVLLYICMVQYKWWHDLVRDYEDQFNSNLRQEYDNFKGNFQGKFVDTYMLFLSRTCFGKHPPLLLTSPQT